MYKLKHFSIIFFMMILIMNCQLGSNHEKTLRKIVRDQYRMVRKPFSRSYGSVIKMNAQPNLIVLSENSHLKNIYHKFHFHPTSHIRTKPHKYSNSKSSNFISSEVRQTRNTTYNSFDVMQFSTDSLPFQDILKENNKHNARIEASFTVTKYPYKISNVSRYFPTLEAEKGAKVEKKHNESENYLQLNNTRKYFDRKYATNLTKKIYSGKAYITKLDIKLPQKTVTSTEKDKRKVYKENVNETNLLGPVKKYDKQQQSVNRETEKDVDFIIFHTNNVTSQYNYDIFKLDICKNNEEISAEIDTQQQFIELDIEPEWLSKGAYWNKHFNSRYETLMRSPRWPHLKVILMPYSHVDTIWRKPFEVYHNNSVKRILSNIVKKLQYYKNLTFTWNEVSHLSYWWKNTTPKSRVAFQRLLRKGKLEITTGAWVEPDEATSHYFGLLHQFIEGHRWLKQNLDYTPKVGLLTNSVTHSPTMTYILSALGISKLVFTNVHFAWEHFLAEFQISDFIWLQRWSYTDRKINALNNELHKLGNSRYPKHAVLSHFLQFNSATQKACRPDTKMCMEEFDFSRPMRNNDINTYNVKVKSETLLEQYSKTGTLTPHNIVIAPIGDAYHYESQSDFDYQYSNYEKIAEFVNRNTEIYKASIEFGTPSNYFANVIGKHNNFPTLKGDFPNYADILSSSPIYWTGYFTTRSFYKIILGRLQSALRTTEILLSFAFNANAFRNYNASKLFVILSKSRTTVARFLDRNSVGGTLGANALRLAQKQILVTAKNLWHIQEIAASLLTSKSSKSTPYLHKYVYREGEFLSSFRSVSPGDHIFLFNSLSYGRTEVVELIIKHPNIRILDHNMKDITIQISPVWRYNSKNIIILSRRYFKVSFTVTIPPLTLGMYKIKETYDVTQNIATVYCSYCAVDEVVENTTFPFSVDPLENGDIQLESYKQRLTFDEYTGFLKSIINKENNQEHIVMIDFGAFHSSENGGMFVFSTNYTKPIKDILMEYKVGLKTKNIIIVSGPVFSQLTVVFGKLLKHSIKIFNLLLKPLSYAIYVDSRVDFEASPKNKNLELFIVIQTDIVNGYPPKIFTDNNGFQYTPRVLNISRRIESNVYPITTTAYIEDNKDRFTFITDHSQGVTAFQEGQLVVMLERRILYDDGRGTNEGLNDNVATFHHNIILLENIENKQEKKYPSRKNNVSLPSLAALQLADYINYVIDIFVAHKYQTDLTTVAFLPLTKGTFPCDISVVNFRIESDLETIPHILPHTSLLILHRRSYYCQIEDSKRTYCTDEAMFSLTDIIRNSKGMYLTNLAGTEQGTMISNIDFTTLSSMELITVRIFL